MEEMLPNPLKNFMPRQNPPKDQQPPAASPVASADITNPEALRTLAKSKLVAIIENAPVSTALVPAIKELLDRIDGKPAQSIAMTVEDKGISKLSDERLLRLERELSRITGEDTLVIAPMPAKLSDTENT